MSIEWKYLLNNYCPQYSFSDIEQENSGFRLALSEELTIRQEIKTHVGEKVQDTTVIGSPKQFAKMETSMGKKVSATLQKII